MTDVVSGRCLVRGSGWRELKISLARVRPPNIYFLCWKKQNKTKTSALPHRIVPLGSASWEKQCPKTSWILFYVNVSSEQLNNNHQQKGQSQAGMKRFRRRRRRRRKSGSQRWMLESGQLILMRPAKAVGSVFLSEQIGSLLRLSTKGSCVLL